MNLKTEALAISPPLTSPNLPADAQAPLRSDLVQTIRPVRSISAIMGFLQKAEVDAIFKQQPIEPDDGASEPFEHWRRSVDAISRLRPTPMDVVEPLSPSLDQVVSEIRSRPTYRRAYESIADYGFGIANIESLLAPQWMADLDYIDELAAGISSTMSIGEQLLFAMREGTITEPIIMGNSVVFTSPRRDLHADPIPRIRPIGGGDFEIVLSASSRPNYVQVAALGHRLLLTNGVHKVCALYKRGFRQVPSIWRRVSRLEDTFLNLQTTLFRPELINGERPAQVLDFLDTEVSVKLKMRATYQVMRLAIMMEQMLVPAIGVRD